MDAPGTRTDGGDLPAFLRSHPPFDRLPDDVLRDLAPKFRPARYATGSTILDAGDGPVGELFLVRKGAVGSRPNNAGAEVDRTLGPGQLFPVGALSVGAATTRVYEAVGETTVLRLARGDFLALREASPEFERFCAQAVTDTLRQSLESLYEQYSQRASEQQTLTRTLGELVRHAPVSAPADAPLATATERMADAKVRTIVAVDGDEKPVGMFTLVDLLRRVVLPGLPLSTPLAKVMSKPVVALPASTTAHDALNTMAERGIRQVVVTDHGRFLGVVNERDLFTLQRISMRQVTEAMWSADSPERLRQAADDIRRLTQNLLAQGIAAEPLTRTIAALNDALSRRAIELVAARHALDGIDWCWLALGSEGRGEQTFATDQDNAIVFDAGDGPADAARDRLLPFAREVNAALATLGFPLCPGNVMAGNPELCLSVQEWEAKFLAWISEPTPQALLQANILFDFRPLTGNAALAEGLREWLFRYTIDNQVFLRLMVQNALEVEPPLGLIRTFSVDDTPEAKGTLDLKVRGTRLFVDAARVLALGFGIADTGTAPRLRQAGRELRVAEREVDAVLEAFQFLQLLRLRRQDATADHGSANRIDPYALNEVGQHMLKEAFRQAETLQSWLRLTYRV